MKVSVVLVVLLFLVPDPGVGKGSTPCPQIKLRFGRVRYRQRGKIARFVCNTGFSLAGDRFSLCVQGRWDGVPRCVRASCKSVRTPANGLIYPSHMGAVLNFFCKSDYELRGPNVTYCDGTRWDSPPPTCLHRDSPAPPLGCDFEEEDLCGWNHDPNHDFDWTRTRFATPSGHIGTGPSFDHTEGLGGEGYYMYIESSARNVNDTARLISPVFDAEAENVCLEFFYHMFGATMGDLRVYLKKVNESWMLEPRDAVFVRSGNQGNRWHRGIVELGAVDQDFQIVIEGVRGKSYVSDIAIDDVRLIPKCTPDDLLEPTTTESPSSSEQPMVVESCENRCQTNDTQKSDSLLTCDCDDGCFERNRCCPDYFDFCAFATSFDDESVTTQPITRMMATSTTTKQPITRMMTTSTTTKKPITRMMTTSTTTKQPITRMITTSTTTKQPITRMMTTSTTTKKPITRMMTKKPVASTTTHPKPQTTKRSKIIYVTPDDVATLPPPTPTDGAATPGLPPKEYEPTDHPNGDKSFNQKIMIPYKEGDSDTKTVIFGVGVVFGLLFAVAGMAFVAKRYRLFRCVRLRRLNHHSGNGDSQSDVRFLTGDEILDLNLPSDYHTM